ncbi:MAG: DUF6596 domain-containing protein, partial [Nitratireductor sp.]
FSVPEAEQWNERLDAVLSTIYVIFTTGYLTNDDVNRNLCQEALFLVRLLDKLRPEDPEIEGALALMLLTDARRAARIGSDGASLPVAEQDRAVWNEAFIEEGQGLLLKAMSRKLPGPFQIKAAIADCHMCDPAPDWKQMCLLFQTLWRHEPTPVVALNWAVVMGEVGQEKFAMQKLNELQNDLSDFQPFYAARANILVKLDRNKEALADYHIAIEKAPNDSSRIFLEKMRNKLEQT